MSKIIPIIQGKRAGVSIVVSDEEEGTRLSIKTPEVEVPHVLLQLPKDDMERVARAVLGISTDSPQNWLDDEESMRLVWASLGTYVKGLEGMEMREIAENPLYLKAKKMYGQLDELVRKLDMPTKPEVG